MKTKKTLGLIIAAVMFTMLFSMTALAKSGTWKVDGGRYWYEYDDGTYPANRVVTIYDSYTNRDEQYAFDVNGYMIENKWVSLSNGLWIYCQSDGSLAKNRWVGDYYLGSNGAMLTDTWTPDGYYVGSDGAWDPSMGRQGSDSGNISDIPNGYYNSVGYSGDTQYYRTDLWVSYSGGTKIVEFGHYESTGSPYGYYDKYNPNGDTLELYMDDGKMYGKSTKDGKKYRVTYDDGTLQIQWQPVAWRSSGTITVDLKNEEGGAVG